MGNFRQELSRLNSEQLEAVQKIDGPLLVVAGPGTGKTQLLSLRVANILDKTDASPDNILCLTFTNKAASNMRSRLLDLVGGESLGVMVKTFHSFAGEVMNLYPDYFWNGAKLTTVPDSVQLEIIQDILASLPLSSPLAKQFAGEFTALSDVQDALKLVKEAGLTPDKLKSLINANLAYIDVIEPIMTDVLSQTISAKKLDGLLNSITDLPSQNIESHTTPILSLDTVIKSSLEFAISKDEGTGKSTNVSKWKRRWLQSADGQKGMFDERRRNNWWNEIASVYQTYREHLHKRGFYDYSDMLVEVITQLEQHPEMLADIQERFLYVMIDEFQDTNPAQLRLAHLVADHPSANGQPNLMVVGDDDQSIFKFNGADLNNMLNFSHFYKVDKPVVLIKNYRSNQELLDCAKEVIELANDRLVKRQPNMSKQLVAAIDSKISANIQHKNFATREHQFSGITKDIAQSYSKNNSLAVLARSHDSLRQIAGMLASRGVPVSYEQQNNILQNQAVEQIYLIAKCLCAIQNGDLPELNQALSTVLRNPVWGATPDELWQLAISNRYKADWLYSLKNHSNQQLSQLAQWLEWLAEESAHLPLQIVLENILGLRSSQCLTSPLRDHYLANKKLSSEYLQTLSAIKLLIYLTHEFISTNKATLGDFVRFVDVNKQNDRAITDTSAFVSAPQAVELLTIHKAKGLEFDSVYIIDAQEDKWRPRTAGRKPPANLPLQPYGDDYDDYVRLMYVAITRAKHNLTISSYRHDEQGQELLPTPLIKTALGQETVEASDDEQTIAVLEENLRWPELTSTSRKLLLAETIDGFSLSATALLDFLDISRGGPSHFIEHSLLRLPQAMTARQVYGTSMHSALEYAQILTNQQEFDFSKVKECLGQNLDRSNLTLEEVQKYKTAGFQTIDKLFNDFGYQLTLGALPEQKMSDVNTQGVRLTGKLDSILVRQPEGLLIVDYKTSKPLTNLHTKDQTKAIKAWSHRTQLTFYALMAKNSSRFKNYTDVECQIVALEAESAKELITTYRPNQEELSRLEQLVNVVWQKITNLELPDISKYSPDYKGIVKFEQDLLEGKI